MGLQDDSIHSIERQFAEIKGALLNDLARIKDDISNVYDKLEKAQQDIAAAVGRIATLGEADKTLADNLKRELEHMQTFVGQSVRESALTMDRDLEKRIPEAIRVGAEAFQKIEQKLRDDFNQALEKLKSEMNQSRTDATSAQSQATAAVKAELATLKTTVDTIKQDVTVSNTKLGFIIAGISTLVSGIVAVLVKMLH